MECDRSGPKWNRTKQVPKAMMVVDQFQFMQFSGDRGRSMTLGERMSGM